MGKSSCDCNSQSRARPFVKHCLQAVLLAEVLALGKQVDGIQTQQQLRQADTSRVASSPPAWLSLAPKVQQAQEEVQASPIRLTAHHQAFVMRVTRMMCMSCVAGHKICFVYNNLHLAMLRSEASCLLMAPVSRQRTQNIVKGMKASSADMPQLVPKPMHTQEPHRWTGVHSTC